MYWTLAMIDFELIAPAEVMKYYPRWIDYVEHLFVLPFAIYQVVMEPQEVPKGSNHDYFSG